MQSLKDAEAHVIINEIFKRNDAGLFGGRTREGEVNVWWKTQGELLSTLGLAAYSRALIAESFIEDWHSDPKPEFSLTEVESSTEEIELCTTKQLIQEMSNRFPDLFLAVSRSAAVAEMGEQPIVSAIFNGDTLVCSGLTTLASKSFIESHRDETDLRVLEVELYADGIAPLLSIWEGLDGCWNIKNCTAGAVTAAGVGELLMHSVLGSLHSVRPNDLN